ncbi:arginine rich protein, partial [Mycobacterium tuberculosis BTB09-058]
LRPGVWCTGR